MLSTFFIRLIITSILEDIFEPPIIQVTGFLLFFVIKFIASISFFNNGPA